MEQVLSCQILLAQFGSTQVRADFVNGKLGPSVNPFTLPQLDELRWSLFPRLQGGSLKEPNFAIKAAKTHAEKLLAMSRDVAATSAEAIKDGISYNEWSQLLEAIATDKY